MKNSYIRRPCKINLSVLAALIFSCINIGAANANEAADDLVNVSGIYTLTNLHPDQENSRLYSTNYLLPFLLPVCTEVKIKKLTKKRMDFVVIKTGKEYDYRWHKKANPGGLKENILLYFGRDCPKDEIKTLSEVDQEGIKKGKFLPGMTRRGVIIAVGYPPPHVTPDLDSEEWMYWMNRFNRQAVVFGENGTVEYTRN